MASGLLITAILIFAVRGMFLGLNGVIGRLVGIALGYLAAYSFRYQLAAQVSQNSSLNMPASLLEIICGLVIFVITLFATGLVINTLFKLAGKFIPGVNAIANQDSLGGKMTGAAVNGLIGAGIVLLGLWGYGKISGNSQTEDAVQQFANRFGDKVFTLVSDNTDLDINTFSSITTTTVQTKTGSGNINTVSTSTGSASIVSSSDPTKRLSIENIQTMIEENTTLSGSGLEQFSNPQLKNLMENSELREQALQLIQNNPEQLQALLKNPKLMELLEQFKTANPKTP